MSEPQKILYEGKDFYIQREGTQIVAITRLSATEYSRLDIKTKRATHWYARKLCERIYYHFPDKQEAIHILCLGSAMGAVPYELLSQYPKARVTCVDIDWESIYIMEKSILKEFEARVTYVEQDARIFVQQCPSETYDIILNDLFTEQDSPPFINSNSFLRSVFRCLKHQGLYLANTITDVFEFTHGLAIEKIGYDVERFTKKKEGMSNIIYEVLKD
jgi:spermidine synthase